MEEYLVKQYGVIEDEERLRDESDIEPYFEDIGQDLLDCGQGYYQDCTKKIVKIKDKFYEVTVTGEILYSKQDVGDALYWVEDIKSVEYKEIEKPSPKPTETVYIAIESWQLDKVKRLLEGIDFEVADCL